MTDYLSERFFNFIVGFSVIMAVIIIVKRILMWSL